MKKKNQNKTRNWVAKHMATFSRSTVERDKKNDYKRKPKHKRNYDD